MVINVEYNQLDPLLRATGFPDGDVNCETGYSPFPGNINQVIFWHKFSYNSHLSPLPIYVLFCFVFSFERPFNVSISDFMKSPAISLDRGILSIQIMLDFFVHFFLRIKDHI